MQIIFYLIFIKIRHYDYSEDKTYDITCDNRHYLKHSCSLNCAESAFLIEIVEFIVSDEIHYRTYNIYYGKKSKEASDTA